MVKFGRLYLQNGNWDDVQVVPEDWVHRSTSYIAEDTLSTTALTGYGYQWWRTSDDYAAALGLRVNDIYLAVGGYGQLISVIPYLDVIIVITASIPENYRQPISELHRTLLSIFIEKFE